MFRCTHCGVVFMHPLPTEEFLRILYSREGKYQRHKPSNTTKTAPTRRFQRFLDFIKPHPNIKKILDVGCSSGEFIFFAKQRGYDVWGVEPNEATASVAQQDGLRVFHGLLHQAQFEDASFDFILLADVIEHSRDPRGLFAECVRILKPGGYIVIETPNFDCFWARATLRLSRLFHLPWSPISPPWHLFHGTSLSWKILADEMRLHFRTEWYYPNPGLKNELGSLHLLKRYKQKKSLINACSMFFGFSLYTVVFTIDRLLTPLLKKNFSMTLIFQK